MSNQIEWDPVAWLRGLWIDLRRAANIFRAMRRVKRWKGENPELARLTREQHRLIWQLLGHTLRLALEITVAIMLILSLGRGQCSIEILKNEG